LGIIRHRHLVAMLSVLAVASAAAPALAAANLLPSGGFEGSGAGTLTG
jgi:hypothetical protein